MNLSYHFWVGFTFVYQKFLNRTIKTGFWVQNHLLNLCSNAVKSQRLLCSQKSNLNEIFKLSFWYTKIIVRKEKNHATFSTYPISWKHFLLRGVTSRDFKSEIYPAPTFGEHVLRFYNKLLFKCPAEKKTQEIFFTRLVDYLLRLQSSIWV